MLLYYECNDVPKLSIIHHDTILIQEIVRLYSASILTLREIRAQSKEVRTTSESAGHHFSAPRIAKLHIDVVQTGAGRMNTRLFYLSLKDGVAAQCLLFCQSESRTSPFGSDRAGLWRWEVESSLHARARSSKGSEQLRNHVSWVQMRRGKFGSHTAARTR